MSHIRDTAKPVATIRVEYGLHALLSVISIPPAI